MDSDYPKMSNLLKIFLRTFENVGPGLRACYALINDTMVEFMFE